MASNTVSDDQARFTYLGMAIIDALTGTLRDLLTREIPPTGIKLEIQKCTTLKLTNDQNLLVDNAHVAGYQQFDITLLCTLLRHVCKCIVQPTMGWKGNKFPRLGEKTVGDDIKRIRLIRNKVYGHIARTHIPEPDYNHYWTMISDICGRMDRVLGSNYSGDLQTIRNCYLDPGLMKKYSDAIISDYKADTSILEAIHDLHEDVMAVNHKEILLEKARTEEARHGENVVLRARIQPKGNIKELRWQMYDDHSTSTIDVTQGKYEGSICNIPQPFLVINDVNCMDRGVYELHIEYRDGSHVYSSIYLNIIGDSPDVRLLDPMPADGNSITIPCHVRSMTPILSLKWKKDEQLLGETISNSRYVNGTVRNPSLTINGTTNRDEGNYSCLVTNCYGTTIETIKLEIPKIYIRNHSRIGRDMHISFEAICCPPPSHIRWKKNGHVLDIPGTTEYLGQHRHVCEINIRDVNHSDSGMYVCSATNALGSTDSVPQQIDITKNGCSLKPY